MAAQKTITVLIASSEIGPFAKTGGMADVCEALPKALVELQVRPTVVLPLYRHITTGGWDIEPVVGNMPVAVGGQEIPADIYRGWLTGEIPAFFVGCDEFFDRTYLYGTPKGDYFDNALRFTFFTNAVIALTEALNLQWDIVHCHDWQTALLPIYMKNLLADRPRFSRTRTVLTIHNLGYQGLFPTERYPLLGLPPQLYDPSGLEFWGKINLLKGGIAFADAVTTVSPTYAAEIRTPELGYGLDGVLVAQQHKLVGILNGVDYATWSPETDRYISQRYSSDDLDGKRQCKQDLLDTLGLPGVLVDKPLFGMISRLAAQKGVDLIAQVAERLMMTGAGLVILGKGDAYYENLLVDMARKYRRQMSVRIDFDDELAHKIEAGSDMFLMPSRYEPCGLNQMYSLRYGTIPIVRRTGGLADTVREVSTKTGKGTGFLFRSYKADTFWRAIEKALRWFSDTELWLKVMRQAMATDFSWSRSARQYHKLYRNILRDA
jgi:starch synthase